MAFLKSTVGRKIVMAVTGMTMLVFVIAHLLGNASIFEGPEGINSYARRLHELVLLIWTYRPIMIIMVLLHVFFGIQLTFENYRAKPESYGVRKSLSATFAGKNMIWTGLILGVFIIYHLLQFTFQVTDPAISAYMNLDAAGRPDVFRMVVLTFRRSVIAFVYIGAMIVLALHLLHGIQSFMQTLGLNNERTMPFFRVIGDLAALIISIGYISIPVVILAGILKG
jgi:succinate dehydrogenase / fumarate reductase cytochrome b subunit